MIDRLEIAGCASYGDVVEHMDGLREINYVYGPNGAGKTTLSRLIADSSPYSRCAVHWQNGTRLETLVYNRDYIARNFNQPGDLKGIFTLGEQSVEILNKIAKARQEDSPKPSRTGPTGWGERMELEGNARNWQASKNALERRAGKSRRNTMRSCKER